MKKLLFNQEQRQIINENDSFSASHYLLQIAFYKFFKNKALVFMLSVLLALFFIGCTADDIAIEEPCECVVDANRFVSFDEGVTWQFHSVDQRDGKLFDCDYYMNTGWFEGQTMYKIVIECE